MLWLFIVLFLLSILYLWQLLLALKDYHEQLVTITENDTNLELRTHSRLPYLKKIILLNNRLIRKHKEARHQLVSETQQLEQAIHNISHDLRTPLTVAGGYTQLLEKDPQMNAPQKELLKKISGNLETVEKHLEQLLNYQRLKEDQIQPVLAEVAVSRLLQEELVKLYQSFEEANIELEVEIQPDLYRITDAKLMSRIFQNILGNLLHHGSTSGRIILKKTGEQIYLTASNQLLSPINHPEKLTERFYTEDLSRQSQNSGLGLFIVQELVDRLNGEMTVNTTEEEFSITIKF